MVHYCSNYDDMSGRAAEIVFSVLSQKSSSVVGVAAGNSPVGLYKILADKVTPVISSGLRCIQLDEYVGISMDDKDSFAFFIKHNFVIPMGISEKNILFLDGAAKDPVRECKRYSNVLVKIGSIDITILGLGINGHIAFNEPYSSPYDTVRMVKLAESSIPKNGKYSEAITLGLKEILGSHLVLLLVSGDNKKGIFNNFINTEPDPQIPASFLKLHPNSLVFVDQTIL